VLFVVSGFVPVVVSLIAGITLPNLVDLVTHSSALRWMRVSVMCVGAVIIGFVSVMLLSSYDSIEFYLLNMILAFIAAMSSYQAGLSHITKMASSNFGLFKQTDDLHWILEKRVIDPNDRGGTHRRDDNL
jgi:hypothetical protein